MVPELVVLEDPTLVVSTPEVLEIVSPVFSEDPSPVVPSPVVPAHPAVPELPAFPVTAKEAILSIYTTALLCV